MDCHEAKQWLATHRDEALSPETLEHIEQCQACRSFEQRLHRVVVAAPPSERSVSSSISTERIMLAVEQQRRISQQLEDIHVQQKRRMARQRSFVLPLAAISILALMLMPFALLDIMLLQPDAMANMPPVLSDLVYVLLMLVQYLQAVSTLTTKNSLVLAAIALFLVILLGTWLRLMRSPHHV